MKISKTTHEAYKRTLQTLICAPTYEVSPRGFKCYEWMNYTTTITQPTYEPIKTCNEKRNETIAEYTKKEFALYESCTNSALEFSKASKFWSSIANSDGTINSAYGKIIWLDELPSTLTPWEWCRGALKDDRDTRQAVLLFMRPDHMKPTRDLLCTCHGHFMFRNDRLHLTIVMRSNDVVKGFVYDLPWFCYLLHKMAKELEVPVGTYTHIAHSMHLYEKDLPLARSMI